MHSMTISHYPFFCHAFQGKILSSKSCSQRETPHLIGKKFNTGLESKFHHDFNQITLTIKRLLVGSFGREQCSPNFGCPVVTKGSKLNARRLTGRQAGRLPSRHTGPKPLCGIELRQQFNTSGPLSFKQNPCLATCPICC